MYFLFLFLINMRLIIDPGALLHQWTSPIAQRTFRLIHNVNIFTKLFNTENYVWFKRSFVEDWISWKQMSRFQVVRRGVQSMKKGFLGGALKQFRTSNSPSYPNRKNESINNRKNVLRQLVEKKTIRTEDTSNLSTAFSSRLNGEEKMTFQLLKPALNLLTLASKLASIILKLAFLSFKLRNALGKAGKSCFKQLLPLPVKPALKLAKTLGKSWLKLKVELEARSGSPA